MKVLISLLSFAIFASVSQAEPFDAFVGVYTPSKSPEVQIQNSPTCNKYDFTQLQSFEVRADRTGFRQTHQLRINVPNGYSEISVVPEFKDPSELDPTVGSFGESDGDDQKAMTVQGSFGLNKNESLKLTIEKTDAGFKLTIANELKNAKGSILNACYYTAELKK